MDGESYIYICRSDDHYINLMDDVTTQYIQAGLWHTYPVWESKYMEKYSDVPVTTNQRVTDSAGGSKEPESHLVSSNMIGIVQKAMQLMP